MASPGALRVPRPTVGLAAPVVMVGALGVGALVAWQPLLALGACVALVVAAAVWARPVIAGYTVVGLTPLIAGVSRGDVIPVLRPSEAVALLVGGTLAVRGVARWGAGPRWRPSRVDLAIVAMAVCGSVVPLMWMALRGVDVSRDDILHAFVLWKYLGVYALVRASVRTDRQVRRCLWISVAAAGAVAVVAVLQALDMFGVPGLLVRFYAPLGDTANLDTRIAQGSSTLGLPAATADLLIFNLALARGLWVREPRRRQRAALAAVAGVLALGALSAGEFSSAIGLLIGVVCTAVVTGAPGLLFLMLPGVGVAYPVLRPVIAKRLEGFQSASGLPESWIGRLNNLRTYFWPELFSRWNFVLGVRPSARVPVASQITGYVWIESGYTWLLWGGGIPLLASFVYFGQVVLTRAWRVARDSAEARGAAATGVFVAMVVIVALMAFDPHLTYRGSADAFFALLALAGLHRAAGDRTELRGTR
ncbi:hypothetical protein R8Z50_24195 [Longispora sp. K20-0274]|uniref:hypothetical protein n=1 Tax=Longispora sp. K20-0274 TaxID=3088255 RepID=UPI00399BE6AF